MSRWSILTTLVLALGRLAFAQDALQTDAASMQRKLTSIAERGEKTPKAAAPLRTTFSDREVNAYFKVHGKEVVPEGLVDPQLSIDTGGKVLARAVVDLDAALKPKDRSFFDPLAWVGGKVEVTASGLLRAANGKGVLTLEHATLGGVTIPKTLLQELISYYSRTPDHPSGFALDQPFDLPARIRSVETRRGTATVVQ